ncbi:hypothetical protein BFP97_19180 [Roseivirga sp. 4D4]|uniref:hypothetical protein n=1 Tax=Roseivirga sp. 4D4 TaxID=1889784 RepID=UPI0008529FFF|nr:hypothetical protein [Roseivirga sp. 4D4]OEK03513.1 hypothetical protein BFP97_19180 [Roseivirga sp. 4D4]
MLKQTQRIERLHHLIRLKATGNAKDCATKLGISERHLYNILDLMKDLGAPIYFNISESSYCYKYDVQWHYGFNKIQD